MHRALQPRGGEKCGLAVALCLFSLAAVGWSQEGNLAAATFYEPLGVQLVNVEVVVVGRDGRPVPGLGAGEFEVFEDGAPVEVTHFFDSSRSAPVRPPAASGEEAEQPPATEGPSQVLYFAVYVDERNLDPRRRRVTLEHLQTFFERPLAAGVRTMLARYTGSIHVLSDFTADRAHLVEALQSLRSQVAMNTMGEQEMLLRDMENQAFAMARGPGGGRSSEIAGIAQRDLLPRIRATAQSFYDRHREDLNALQRFVSFLSGLSGRKAVLWVSDGFEPRSGETMFREWASLFPSQARSSAFNALHEGRRFDLTPELRNLVRFANAHRVSFHTLGNLTGERSRAISAELRDLGVGDGPGIGGVLAEEETLIFLSGFTGGRSVEDNPGLAEQLGAVTGELLSAYSLGYVPPSPGDGKYHKISVRVRRQGVRLRYRQGYQDRGAADMAADRTVAAAVLGAADNPLRIRVSCRDQSPRSDGKYLVPVLISIPIGQLLLVPEGDHHSGAIEVLSVERTVSGAMSDVTRREYPVEVPNHDLARAVGQEAGFLLGLILDPGPWRIAVSVRDRRSGVTSTAFVDVDVGRKIGDEPA